MELDSTNCQCIILLKYINHSPTFFAVIVVTMGFFFDFVWLIVP